MIDLYYWTTPNGHKITIFLEETGLPYKIIPVDITKGDQFSKEFLKISPNNKIPALIDHAPMDNSGPLAIFESAAILLYLAEKTGHFFPKDSRRRFETIQWLIWQVANLGPMSGQNHYFSRYADEKVPQAITRYQSITKHLYDVLEKQLKEKDFVIGKDYTIADMAIYPWTVSDQKDEVNLDDFPAIKRWFARINERPAVRRAYAKADEINKQKQIDDNGKKVLFNK